MPIAVGLSFFGTLNATMFSWSRTILSAARERQLPFALSFIHTKRRTPIPAAMSILVISTIWILAPGVDIQGLIAIYSLAIWTQYLLSIFSVIVMRIRRPDLERPFKVWIINPIFISIIGLFLVIIPFVKRPVESGICWALLLSSFPVYFVFIKRQDRLPSCLHRALDAINEFLRRKCNLVPCIFVREDDTPKNPSKVNDTVKDDERDAFSASTNL